MPQRLARAMAQRSRRSEGNGAAKNRRVSAMYGQVDCGCGARQRHRNAERLAELHHGGRPQVRERVFIVGTLTQSDDHGSIHEPGLPDLSTLKAAWDPQEWKLSKDLPLDKLTANQKKEVALTDDELIWINAWSEFVEIFKKNTVF